jgi:hypothetical protein
MYWPSDYLMSMIRSAKIRDNIVPIATVMVILLVGLFSLTRMAPQGTAESIGAWLLLFISFCILFSIFPVIAILYGWYTGNRARAMIAGFLLLPLFYIAGYLLISPNNMVFVRLPETAIFIFTLSALCGLAGLCAAQRTKNYLAVSIILTGLWLIIWMWGFN